jgi:hypothetical protein
VAFVNKVIEETIRTDQTRPQPEGLPYISPSSMARGCVLAVAYELLGTPKPELEPRIKRILAVGSDSHRRIQRYLSRLTIAREVFFQDEEYHIRGYADALLYIPSIVNPPAVVGGRPTADISRFYAVEIKTTGTAEFERIVTDGQAKPDHLLQLQVYLWGIERYYRVIRSQGGLVLYENRDNLEHHLFFAPRDDSVLLPYLERLKAMLARVAKGELPDGEEDSLPPDHWAHSYCPYLEPCQAGQRAVEYKKTHRQALPDQVMAKIIADRIVAKKRREGGQPKKKKGPRSLDELAEQLHWD